MKLQNKIAILLLCVAGRAIFGTEIDIINKSGWVITVTPKLRLLGKESEGTLVANIAPLKGVEHYSSGIYTIIGFDVMRTKQGTDRTVYSRGFIQGLPSIDKTNTKAVLVFETNDVVSFYPDRRDRNNFSAAIVNITDKWEGSGIGRV